MICDLSKNMEVFHSLKFVLKLFGILEWQFPSPFQHFPITLVQRVIVFISLTISLVTTSWFFIFEADKLNEYAESFNIALSSLSVLVCYSIAVWKRKQIEYFLKSIQQIIQNRNFIPNDIEFKTKESHTQFICRHRFD